MAWWQYANNNPGHMVLYLIVIAVWSGWVVDRAFKRIGGAIIACATGFYVPRSTLPIGMEFTNPHGD